MRENSFTEDVTKKGIQLVVVAVVVVGMLYIYLFILIVMYDCKPDLVLTFLP